jgi:cell division protein FtsI (penicillin-binding protein 3)
VIDTPTVGSRYGAETSAPVFREVAQEVLEYLGVPHDQPLKTTKQMAVAPNEVAEDGPSENTGDLNAMFDEINNLPPDDPLRAGSGATAASAAPAADPAPAPAPPRVSSAPKPAPVLSLLPQKVMAAFRASGGGDSGIVAGTAVASTPLHPPTVAPQVQPRANGSVVVDAGRRVAVPSFTGAAVRNVVETAASLGLRVEPVGSGTAREQAPQAGTLVPLGTEVVVRFER